MSGKKIVITGGPGTGKSTIINELIKRNFICMPEISRDVTIKAQNEGVDQLFLSNPLLFSELLLKGRKEQYDKSTALNSDIIFFDRGIPDVLAYMDYIGDAYPKSFINTTRANAYNSIFILKPWKAIYKSDNERYENFEQAKEIYKHLLNTYKDYNYTPIDVPFGTVEERTNFILNTLDIK